MTLLYSDPVFLGHETGAHPENPGRLRRATEHLVQSGSKDRCRSVNWSPASLDRLLKTHSAEYIQSINTFASGGGGMIESDTVVSPQSYEVALLAAGAVCDAVGRVLSGEDQNALCLVRPPGHHALQRSAMGFCLFNNVAVAAKSAIDECGLDRVLIVDWDVHHGNGTQDAFWDDDQIAFFSSHRWPFYPGTGDTSETGSGRGLGYTCNLPVTFGTPRSEFLSRFTQELEAFAAKVKPQLVIISAGFDAHRLDPIGSLGLEVEDFAELTRAVLEVANGYADGKVVSALEGGYNPDQLALCVEAHLRELLHQGNDGK